MDKIFYEKMALDIVNFEQCGLLIHQQQFYIHFLNSMIPKFPVTHILKL